MANDRTILVQHGGYLSLTWGRNILYRMERRQEDDNENGYHWEDAIAPGVLKEATALLEMFEEDDGRVPKRGKIRH